MAEIKSTIDLVMERTRHMIMSEEERRAAERAEHLEKAPGYVHKVVEGLWQPEHLQEALAQVPASFREAVRMEVIRGLMDRLESSESAGAAVAALKALAREGERRLVEELGRLLEAFDSQTEEAESEQKKALLSELEKMGIRGDAIQVGSPGKSPREDARRDRLVRRIEEIKGAWLSGAKS